MLRKFFEELCLVELHQLSLIADKRTCTWATIVKNFVYRGSLPTSHNNLCVAKLCWLVILVLCQND